MSMYGRSRVKVPASTANLGPGFDTLGMALSLYAWIEMEEAEETVFHFYGDQMNGLPCDKSNLLYQVAQMVFAEAGVSVPELSISMYSDIPLTRGLGSSASAIVGALAAANTMIGSPLDNAKLFDMACSLEKHPDNVGASLFGGMITAVWDGTHADYIRIEPPRDMEVLVVIPEFELATTKARGVIPAEITVSDAVYNISRTSLLTAAFAAGRLDLIGRAMLDRLHQPYRAPLVPGMEKLLAEAPQHGALGIALSGAGPTLLCLVDAGSSQKQELELFLKETMAEHGIPAQTRWLPPCTDGVTAELLQRNGMQNGSFLDMIKGEIQS
ncbi:MULTISPECIES: homoserine kinase [unclassified Paenibacillus]|uniref:homoserine kinase n=1 Tax=unclassified Paenibacillus TaxID=185978 RepID=UPI002405D9E6|nr:MULTISPECIES: homoserine kinase [unclassified Paenibacillus]MDF9843990.1 homoserine kinase [Paenibacillus sp. PastF-2]MDF9850595.1 homoserine kinase [Paenibacillus sp. PastM-2]MDF9857255.1 homoserine kinase [Paenibacillus sp. PastF-1]MDH6482445.1 homoserine kinase [Paenibacillus sp. PastH-2]MDH6509952.1 homoserine kinase [Paenibacillus sp. PastM-3]